MVYGKVRYPKAKGDCGVKEDLLYKMCLPTSADTPFTTPVQNKFVREASALLKNSVVLLSSSEITERTAATKLRSLNAMEIIVIWGGRGQMVSPNCQKQGWYIYCN